jgi:hypothetical protein
MELRRAIFLTSLVLHGVWVRPREDRSACRLQKDVCVHQNNLVYKGFRLNAQVYRSFPEEGAGDVGDGPHFAATVRLIPADGVQSLGDEFTVPTFAQGHFVESPRDAVNLAVSHGCDIVDALIGVLFLTPRV